MRLLLPSASSKLHAVSRRAVRPAGAAELPEPPARALCTALEGCAEVVFCRGRDIPALVGSGFADVGMTGYDVAVEWMLRTGTLLDIRLWQPGRLSFVTFVTVPGRQITRIYTEYLEITRQWIRSSQTYRGARLIPLAGSSEGVIRADPEAGGVVVVTTGLTLHANDLAFSVPLLATDLCVVRLTADNATIGTVPLNSLPELGLPSFCRIPTASPDNVAEHVDHLSQRS